MTNNKNISIITVNYNGFDDSCIFIESCYKYIDDYILEIIVVDNGSKKDESKLLKNRFPQIKAIRSEKNLGFAGANNLGIKLANGEFLFFLNNDIIITKPNIDSLISALNKSEKIAGVSPLILNNDSINSIQYAGFTKLTTITMRNKSIGENEHNDNQFKRCQTPYLHGAAMLFKAKAIQQVGLMDEEYFLYYEELDWCERFRRNNYELWIEPSYELIHKNSNTIGAESPLKAYYLTRNRLLFAKKNRNTFTFLLILLYMLILSIPKNLIKACISKRKDLIIAYCQGLCSFIRLYFL